MGIVIANEKTIGRLVSQGREHLAAIKEQGVEAGIEFSKEHMTYADLDRVVEAADFDEEGFDLYVFLSTDVPPSIVNMLYEPTTQLVTPLKIEAWERGVVRGFQIVLDQVNSKLELT
ncbi:MAG: hypothetical protein ACK5PB_14055 [Pirellula sp.]